MCPVKALSHRVKHLRASNASPNSPLYSLPSDECTDISSTDITAALKSACSRVGASCGIHPGDISARALRAGGAMALLRANVDPVEIRLLGRWQSWAMLSYLHSSSTPSPDLATKMLQGGSFRINAHQTLPDDVATRVAAIGITCSASA